MRDEASWSRKLYEINNPSNFSQGCKNHILEKLTAPHELFAQLSQLRGDNNYVFQDWRLQLLC